MKPRHYRHGYGGQLCRLLCVSVCLCPRSQEKTARAIETKLDTRYSPRQLLVVLRKQGQKVRGQGQTVSKKNHGHKNMLLRPCAAAA